MKRAIAFTLLTVAAFAVWTVLVLAAARDGWFQAMPAVKGDDTGFVRWAERRYAAESRGNIALIMLDGNRIAGRYFASHGRPVNEDSLFQVASMSKFVTAWGVMSLVDRHRIDLDAPVARYLTRWRLPPSAYDNNAVTVRRLLSHTAGLTDGLGFLGYAPGKPVPSLEQELTHTGDVWPGANGSVRVGAPPGQGWRYSGGGYLILQLLIEDVTKEPFRTYMHRAVLQPLGMAGSTFTDPDPSRIADFFGPDGKQALHYRFAATGAASLYTSSSDMTRFLQAQLPGADGALPGRGVLSPATLRNMRTRQASVYGFPLWGLGEILYVPNAAGSYVIGHDGNNFPAINTTARIDPATGDGIVVLETGSSRLASEIGGAWTYWHSGKVDFATLIVFDSRNILIAIRSGWLVILIAAALFTRRQARNRTSVA